MGTGDPGGKADAERVYTRRSAWQLHDPHARVTSPGGTRGGTHGWDRAGLRPGVGQIWDSSFHAASRSTTEVPNQMPPCPDGTPGAGLGTGEGRHLLRLCRGSAGPAWKKLCTRRLCRKAREDVENSCLRTRRRRGLAPCGPASAWTPRPEHTAVYFRYKKQTVFLRKRILFSNALPIGGSGQKKPICKNLIHRCIFNFL